MKPDSEKLLLVASRLRRAEFAPFTDWLAAERSQRLEHLATCQATAFSQLQGEAAILKQILNLIETASGQLDRMAGRKP